jgi:hypothetical protein
MHWPFMLNHLLAAVDEAYDRVSWHGTNLRGSIRGVSPRQAAWRPGAGRHNIWELVVHAAYWKYAVWRRLTGAKRGSFPLEGSNWFTRPAGPGGMTLRAWKTDIALLESQHRALRAAIAALPASSVGRRVSAGGPTRLHLIQGITAHDLYHAGQIQVIKRLGGK